MVNMVQEEMNCDLCSDFRYIIHVHHDVTGYPTAISVPTSVYQRVSLRRLLQPCVGHLGCADHNCESYIITIQQSWELESVNLTLVQN